MTVDVGELGLVGGELCLDFTNTVGNHSGSPRSEHLASYADLVTWSRRAGLLSDEGARRLLGKAERQPADARRVLERAIEFREALYRILSGLAQHRQAAAADLAVLNRNLREALAHGEIRPAANGLHWEWERAEDALDAMLWPIARSAETLLTSERLQHVRECDGDTCEWLFVDMSKNHSRRWCSMDDCGNRAKVNRFYRRKRARRPAQAPAAERDETAPRAYSN